jgi:DNA repair photolyase
MPILPFVNDTKKNIRELVLKARDAGASYIFPMFGVTLRKGSRDYFYRALDHGFPEIKEKYQTRFGERYKCNSPNFKQLIDTFYELTEKYGIDTRIKFYDPPVCNQLSLF